MWVKQKTSGFTIVELLIVIVVIGILAAITIVAYNGIQSRSNSAKVQQDLKSMQKLVELYKAENGSYPSSGGAWSYSSSSPDGFIPSVVPTFASSLPRFTADSVVNSGHCYVYNSNGTDYKIIRLGQPSLSSDEQATIPAAMKDQYSGSDRYGVWSPGGVSF
jgi:prepilin-type N-terminal cleavage/methylation domain-containing protein